MWTRIFVTLAILFVGSSRAWANDPNKSAIQELQREKEALKKERQAKTKAVSDLFRRLEQNDKLTESELDQHRKSLKAQRNHLLKLTVKEEEGTAIHRHYDLIIEKLGSKERLERKDIEKLRGEEKHMIALLQKHYDAAIGQLQKQIEALQHQPKSKPTPKPKPAPKSTGNRQESRQKNLPNDTFMSRYQPAAQVLKLRFPCLSSRRDGSD